MSHDQYKNCVFREIKKKQYTLQNMSVVLCKGKLRSCDNIRGALSVNCDIVISVLLCVVQLTRNALKNKILFVLPFVVVYLN